jgi:hypothetical protein
VVVAAREELLMVLGKIGEALPGDSWVLSQRIRYLGDFGRWMEAEALARRCPGHLGWWCDALLGYVLHRAGETVEAHQAFSRALAGMDPDRAAEWMDPSPLLDYAEGRWLDGSGTGDREKAMDRFWILADPLFLTPGNERLTEHFARHFGPNLYENSAITMGLSWGGAFEQLLLRYGFIAGWEQTPAGINAREVRNVVEHHHPESRGLLPPLEALRNPGGLPEGLWKPRDERPRSASAPVLAPLVAEGEAQTAVFRRDGELLVVASYGLPGDTVWARRRGEPGPDGRRSGRRREEPPRRPIWEPGVETLPVDTLTGLFLLPDTGEGAPTASLGRGGRGVLHLRVPPGEYLLSVEQWCPGGRWGARVRHGVRGGAIPPDVPHMSDLLLLEAGDDLPASLTDALPRALPGTALGSTGRVTVAWEVYGLARRQEPLEFRLSLEEEEGGLLRRALGRIGLFRRDPALTLAWNENGVEFGGPLFRAVELDLPELDPGRYLLTLEMRIPYRNRVVSDRWITVR